MQLPPSVLLLVSLFSAAHLALGRPTAPRPRDINISHKSVVNGTATTHSIPTSSLPAELAAAIEGSDININLCVPAATLLPALELTSTNLQHN